jgi:hypothetical protein
MIAGRFSAGDGCGARTGACPDPITAAFVEAICHHTLATPAHLQSLLEPRHG